MIGSVGIDVQDSRAAACLLEWPDQATGRGAARQGAIGDGRRLLIPVAATPDDAGEPCWGSAAAEVALSRVTADGASATAGAAAMLAPALLAWRTDPWGEEFLGGLRQRLLRYLGLPPTGRVRGHQLSFCADPGPAGDWADAARALEDASLPDAEFLRPADALLCRWLAADPDLSRSRTVLAVAYGETTTDLGLYAVEGSQGAVGRLDGAHMETGAAGWLAERRRGTGLAARIRPRGHCCPCSTGRTNSPPRCGRRRRKPGSNGRGRCPSTCSSRTAPAGRSCRAIRRCPPGPCPSPRPPASCRAARPGRSLSWPRRRRCHLAIRGRPARRDARRRCPGRRRMGERRPGTGPGVRCLLVAAVEALLRARPHEGQLTVAGGEHVQQPGCPAGATRRASAARRRRHESGSRAAGSRAAVGR